MREKFKKMMFQHSKECQNWTKGSKKPTKSKLKPSLMRKTNILHLVKEFSFIKTAKIWVFESQGKQGLLPMLNRIESNQ